MSNVLSLAEFRRHNSTIQRAVDEPETASRGDVILLSVNQRQEGDISGPEALQNKEKVNVPDEMKKRAKKGTKKTGEKSLQADKKMSVADFRQAVEEASDKQLKALFPDSWRKHDTLKKRTARKSNAYEMHADLKPFRGFLRAMGRPCPSIAHTVDRLDSLDFLYAPGGLRWADPKQQANNRTSNIPVTWRGATRTLSEWAGVAGIPYQTMKKRHQRGATTAQLFKGAAVQRYAPGLQDWTESREARPRLPDDVELKLAGPPVPAWPSDPNAWPLGVEARSFDRGYRQMLAHAHKAGAKPYSRKGFCLLVHASRFFAASRDVIGAKHAHLIFPDQVEPEALADLRAAAAADPAVLQYLADRALYQCCIEAYVAELRQIRGRRRDVTDHEVWQEIAGIEHIAKSHPVLAPGDGYKLYSEKEALRRRRGAQGRP